MNWFKQIKYSFLFKTSYTEGEWWIDEDGNASFADGDVGDKNHIFYVFEKIISDHLGHYDEDDFFNLVSSNYDALLQQGFSIEEAQVLKEKIDPREYAMKKWGWIRVSDRYVQCWDLTNDKIRNIANGLFETADENVYHNTFIIEDLYTKSNYEDVPFKILELESVDELKPFNKSYHYIGRFANNNKNLKKNKT